MITAEGRILENDTLPCYQDTNNSNPFLPEGYLRISVPYTAIPDRQFIPISILSLSFIQFFSSPLLKKHK